MKYFRATVSVLNTVITPRSKRIFVVRKKRNKNAHLDFFDVHIGVYIALKIFSVCLFTPSKVKKGHVWVHPPIYPRKWPLWKKLRCKLEVRFIVNKSTLVPFLYLRSNCVYFCKQKQFSETSVVSLNGRHRPLYYEQIKVWPESLCEIPELRSINRLCN